MKPISQGVVRWAQGRWGRGGQGGGREGEGAEGKGGRPLSGAVGQQDPRSDGVRKLVYKINCGENLAFCQTIGVYISKRPAKKAAEDPLKSQTLLPQ